MNLVRTMSSFEIQTNQTELSTSRYYDMFHLILLRIVRPPVVIFGIAGNIVNIIILWKNIKLRKTSAIKILLAMSIMDLFSLILILAYAFLEWIKTTAFLYGIIFIYYSLYLKYGLILFFLNFKILCVYRKRLTSKKFDISNG